MKRKMFILFLAAVVLSVLAFSACNSSKSKKIKNINIGFPSSGSDWPTYTFGVSYTYGYLDEYLEPLGYKAIPKGFVGAAPAIHEALIAKELDYVVYAGMASVLSKSVGIDHTLINVGRWGAGFKMIARVDAGIDTLADLRGKTIAYRRGAAPHMYLIRILNEAGLTFNDIVPLNSTGPDSIAGIISGTVDATVIEAGYEKTLVQDGVAKVVHVQFYADRDVYFEPNVFIARTEFHQEHPEVTLAIQKAFLKAKDWIKEDPDRYYRLVAEKTTNPLEVILETADYDIDNLLPLNLEEKYVNSLKDILFFLRENELTNGTIDFETWPDRTIWVKALEEYNRGK